MNVFGVCGNAHILLMILNTFSTLNRYVNLMLLTNKLDAESDQRQQHMLHIDRMVGVVEQHKVRPLSSLSRRI